jgi:hypothetical protein
LKVVQRELLGAHEQVVVVIMCRVTSDGRTCFVDNKVPTQGVGLFSMKEVEKSKLKLKTIKHATVSRANKNQQR